MSPHRQASRVLRLAASGTEPTDAARRLLVAGIDREQLDQTRVAIEALDLERDLRDRALLLLEQTELLAERSAARTAEGAQLRARAEDAAATTTDDPSTPDSRGASRTAETPDGERRRSMGMLVHELRTPLTVAQMAAQYLSDHLDDRDAVERMSAMVRRNTNMALYLIDHLALTDELRAGELHLEVVEVDLVTLVTDCVQDVRQLLPEERAIDLRMEDGIAPVLADPSAIRQVIFNLLVNAAKYSPSSTPIEVTVHRDGLSVRDHGGGVAPAERERIFDEGSQADPSAAGSGLGLFISRRVASAHGGDLVLEDPAGSGARFTLRLPVAGSPRAASPAQRQAIADLRDAILDRRERLAHEREDTLRQREVTARRRDVGLQQREEQATRRDRALDRRETAAGVRERVLEERERHDEPADPSAWSDGEG